MRFRLKLRLLIGILLGCCMLVIALRHETPTRSLTITTETIPTLLPHAHGAADKVSDGHHGVETRSPAVTVPETMWVTEIAVSTKNAPRNIIHHLHLIRVLPDGTRDFLTSSVFTVGQDTVSVVRLPAPSGILFRQGEQIGLDVILHNPIPPHGEGGVYKDVQVEVTLTGVGDHEGRYLPVSFDLPRVTDSTESDDDDSTFAVPVGLTPFTRTSADNPEGALGASHRFVSDGWIVYMGAHMHPWEGGTRVDAYLNDRRVRTYTSHLTDANIPWSFTTEAAPALIRVRAGDVLTVSATYTNINDIPLEGAMGMVGVYYVADRFTLGSPLYAIAWTLEGWYRGIEDAVNRPW